MEPPIDKLRSLPFASLLLSHPLLPSFSDTSFFKLMLSFSFRLKNPNILSSFSLFPCLFFPPSCPPPSVPLLLFSSLYACQLLLIFKLFPTGAWQIAADSCHYFVHFFLNFNVYIANLLRIWCFSPDVLLSAVRGKKLPAASLSSPCILRAQSKCCNTSVTHCLLQTHPGSYLYTVSGICIVVCVCVVVVPCGERKAPGTGMCFEVETE